MKAFQFEDQYEVWAAGSAQQAAEIAKEWTGEDHDPADARELTDEELDAEVLCVGEPSDPNATTTLRAELASMSEPGFLAGPAD